MTDRFSLQAPYSRDQDTQRGVVVTPRAAPLAGWFPLQDAHQSETGRDQEGHSLPRDAIAARVSSHEARVPKVSGYCIGEGTQASDSCSLIQHFSRVHPRSLCRRYHRMIRFCFSVRWLLYPRQPSDLFFSTVRPVRVFAVTYFCPVSGSVVRISG